jgi:hypothetical protein
MDAVYLEIRDIARGIVARSPRPDFYDDYVSEARQSRRFYRSDAAINKLRNQMVDFLDDDFGHGMGHVEKVAIDAGTLVIVESRNDGYDADHVRRQLLLAQCAGLLHDICRKQPSHARKGARAAHDILSTYPLTPEEIAIVCAAIRNHEAFIQTEDLPTRQARMVSDCLYDADKFRWGPDNFAHTLWDMVGYLDPPLKTFLAHYPKGMALLKKIGGTFRSETGRHYGPQFIQIGLAIGDALHHIIQTDFVDRT